jgi:lysophospholipase
MTNDLAFHFFPCPSGGQMRIGEAKTEPAKGDVLILPGLGEWIEKYEELIGEWNSRGFSVHILEWQGQGLSTRLHPDRRKMHLESFNPFLVDLEAFYEKHLAKAETLVIFAHSMGAHLGLRWLVEREKAPVNLRALILSSILHEVYTKPIPLWAARLITKTAVKTGFAQAYLPGWDKYDQAGIPFDDNILTRDLPRYTRMLERLLMQPELKAGALTHGWLHAAFESMAKLDAALPKNPPRIPVLLLGTEMDKVVDIRGVKRVAGFLPRAETLYFTDTHHEIMQEKEDVRAKAWAAMDALIQSSLRA